MTAILERLIAAGTPAHLVAEVAIELARREIPSEKSGAARRQAAYRQRQKDAAVTHNKPITKHNGSVTPITPVMPPSPSSLPPIPPLPPSPFSPGTPQPLTPYIPLSPPTHQPLPSAATGDDLQLFFDSEPPPTKPIPASKRIKWSEQTGWTGIEDRERAEWKSGFPACNIDRQLQLAHLWLKANPSKRKSNYLKFLNNWLKRAQDRGGDSDAPCSVHPSEKDEFQMLLDGIFRRDSSEPWTSQEQDAYAACNRSVDEEAARKVAVLYRSNDASLNEWQRPRSLLGFLRRMSEVLDFAKMYRPPSAL